MKQKKKSQKLKRQFNIDDLPTLLGYPELQQIRYEARPKNKSISLRLNADLLTAIKNTAEIVGIDYQKWIRNAIEESLRKRTF